MVNYEPMVNNSVNNGVMVNQYWLLVNNQLMVTVMMVLVSNG